MSILAIIIDLDGCLVDARELHYESLNRALHHVAPRFVISREEHLSTYDGLNTSRKLEILTEKKGLPKNSYKQIWDLKQKETLRLIDKMEPDEQKIELLRSLKEKGHTVIVASNSIRQTLKMMLLKRGLLEYVDFYLSNEDVIKPKPSAEIYLRAMIKAHVSPKETLIIEDSPTGRKAAESTGAMVMPVTGPDELTLDRVMSYIDKPSKPTGWTDPKLNILIPMAGKGSRFAEAGYVFPKPLIEVNNGNPMIQTVVNNLNFNAHYIFIVQKEHYDTYHLKTMLGLIAPGCDIITIDHITEGAAVTTLTAKNLINNENPLIIANSDQFLGDGWDPSTFMWNMNSDGIAAGLVTFSNLHPKWSFARIGADGFVEQVAEKNPISDIASVGVYYFAKGCEYVMMAERMIGYNKRSLGEFYVCPVLQEYINVGMKVKNYHIDDFWGLGTPADLQHFLANYHF